MPHAGQVLWLGLPERDKRGADGQRKMAWCVSGTERSNIH